MDSFLGWHSECGGGSEGRGVMMINSHYKQNIDFDKQIEKFGQQIIEMEDQGHQDTYNDAVDDDYTEQLEKQKQL